MKLYLLLLLLIIPAVHAATPFCAENRITANYNSISPIFCLGKDANEQPIFSVEATGQGTGIPFISFTAVSDKGSTTITMTDPNPERLFAKYRKFATFTAPLSKLGESGFNGKVFKIIPSVSENYEDAIPCSDSTGIVFSINDLVDCSTKQQITDIANASGMTLNSIVPLLKNQDDIIKQIEDVQSQIKAEPENNTELTNSQVAANAVKKFFFGIGGVLIIMLVVLSVILLQHLFKDSMNERKEDAMALKAALQQRKAIIDRFKPKNKSKKKIIRKN